MGSGIRVHLVVAELVAAGAIVGTLIGAGLAQRLPVAAFRRLLAVAMAVVAARTALKPIGPAAPRRDGPGADEGAGEPAHRKGGASDRE